MKNITEFGIFIGIEDGIDGLIHVSDISWTKKVRHPGEMYKSGDTVMAKVLTVDKENEKSTLGIKQLSEDPWTRVPDTYPVGAMVMGTVTNITDFGLFVEGRGGHRGPSPRVRDQPQEGQDPGRAVQGRGRDRSQGHPRQRRRAPPGLVHQVHQGRRGQAQVQGIAPPGLRTRAATSANCCARSWKRMPSDKMSFASRRPGLFGLMIVMAAVIPVSGIMAAFGVKRGEEGERMFGTPEARIRPARIEGPIADAEDAVAFIRTLREDQSVKGVIPRINSPGGAFGPSQELYMAVKHLVAVKPVVASFSAVAASGGYYAACPATKILANPGTITGSIGVMEPVRQRPGTAPEGRDQLRILDHRSAQGRRHPFS